MMVRVTPRNDPKALQYFDTEEFEVVALVGILDAEFELTENDDSSIELWDRHANRLWARSTSENTLIIKVEDR